MKSTKDGRPRNAWVTTNSKARQGVRKNPHVVAHLSAEIRNVCLDNITLYQTSFALPNQTLLVIFVAHLGKFTPCTASKIWEFNDLDSTVLIYRSGKHTYEARKPSKSFNIIENKNAKLLHKSLKMLSLIASKVKSLIV